MRKLIWLPCLILSACATTSALKTFNDVYTDAMTADDLVVETATSALSQGLITSTQAAHIQVITIDAKNLLNAAQIAFTAGNQIAANADVSAAASTLVAMSLCLTQKPLTVATFTACADNVPALRKTK